MPRPSVGVVIPLFQSQATIAPTLRSLQDQTLRSWHAVVVNDGSTDDGPTIARRFEADDPRIRVIDQPNRGLSGARNRGLECIDADHLMLLDADDLLFPTALEHLTRAIAETGLPGAFCGYEFLDDDARSIGRQTVASLESAGIDELLDWNRFVVHSQLIRTDALGTQAMGRAGWGGFRFDESLRSGEDYDLWLRLAERGVRWSGVDRFLVGYRIRAGSMSKDFGRMAANESGIIRRSFERLRGGSAPTPIDLSSDRERDAICRSALAYASRVAIGPRADLDGALDLLGEPPAGSAFDPGAVATASIFAIQFGAAAAPDIVTRDPRAWIPSLDRWWRALVSRRWTEEADPDRFVDRAIEAFASRSIHPGDVARETIRRAVDTGGPIVAPFDARSRWIGRVGPECGVRTIFAGAGAERLGAGARHDVGPASLLVESAADLPAHDDRTIAVVPPGAGGPGAITSDEVQRALAHQAAARLRSCWDTQAPRSRNGGDAAAARTKPTARITR